MEVCDYKVREKVSQAFVDDILHLFSIFIEKGINVFARDGLLLGAVRHGGFLPFDTDPDVGVLAEDWESLKNLKIPGYEIVLPPKARNFSFYFKTGKPYDFAIYKTRKGKTFYNFLLLFLIFCVLLFVEDNLVRFSLIFIFLILFIWSNLVPGQKILDGTVYPANITTKKEKISPNDSHYQEVEVGEKHVFRDHYGHDSESDKFTFDKSDVLPLTTVRFYEGEILAPRNYTKILLEHYGQDVFQVMYKKEDKDMKKINIENCIAPPAELVEKI